MVNNFDIVILIETWLNDTISDNEIFDSRYNVYRRDRESSTFNNYKKTDGGVLIAVSTRLKSKRVIEWESGMEDLWVEVSIKVNKQIETLCSVYLPPAICKEYLDTFIEAANKTIIKPCKYTLVVGDFNMSGVTWNSTDGDMNGDNNGSILKDMLADFMSLHNFKQYNYILNNKDKILDLIFCDAEIVSVDLCRDPIRDVDKLHPPLIFSLDIPKCESTTKLYGSKYNFRKADYKTILHSLNNICWSSELAGHNDVNKMLDIFYKILRKVIEEHIPKRVNFRNNYPVWFTYDLIRILKIKYKLHRKIKQYNNPLDVIEFEYIRKDCNIMLSNCYRRYINTIENNLIKNPKYFFSFIKSLRNKNSNYPTVMYLNNVKASTSDGISNLFAHHFASVYENKIDNNVPIKTITEDLNYIHCNEIINKITFTEDIVLKKLKLLKVDKGCGPDNIPPIFLFNCASALVVPITMIFNTSIEQGVFPDLLKETRIVPVHKKGNKTDISNYRPISILSTIAKIFESLIYPLLLDHVKNSLSIGQHGFLPKRSTNTNLVNYIHQAAESVDQNIQVDAIYTDFSSAFDKVDHNILVRKLQAYGVRHPLLGWRKSLDNRASRVVLNGRALYDTLRGTSGINFRASFF